MTWWDFNDVREVDAVSGCCSLVRRRALEQVGLMDETYFVYGDDSDWCYRFKKRGWRIMFTPEAQIIHYGGQTTSQKARAFRLQLEGSRLIFMKLYRNKVVFPLACLLTGLFFFLRVPYWLGIGLLKRRGKANRPLERAATYLIGSFYCWTNWKKLLMNRKAIEGRL